MAKYDLQIDRLIAAMRRSRQALEPYRNNRKKMVEQYVGPNWGPDGSKQKVPVNLIEQYVRIMGRSLIAKNPRVMLSTFRREYKPTVDALQTWINQELDSIGLANTLRRVVTDALFSVGICKVAICSPVDAANAAWSLAAGSPCVYPIDLDDFVVDMHTRDLSCPSLVGHRYRAPREAAIAMLGKRAKDLAASPDKLFNEQGDERINVLGRGTMTGNDDEYEDMVDLWEIYLPRHKRVVTLPDDYFSGPVEHSGDVLLDQPWLGPDCGPYHILGYGTVPGNAMPLAPVPNLYELHMAANRAFRKMIATLERVKEVTLIEGSAGEDGSRVQDANDGEIIKVNNPKSMAQVVFSGQHLQMVMGAGMTFEQMFSKMGGNLDLLGGLGPQSKTAHQDDMLNRNAGVGVGDMQDSTVTFISNVIDSLLWLHYHHPQAVMQAPHKIPGMNRSILRQIYPNAPQYTDPDHKEFAGRPLHVRDIAYTDLNLRIDPYSLQHSTPQSRLQFLVQTVTQIVAPMLPMAQQQGISIDWNTLFRKIGEYADQPDLEEVLTIMEAPTPQAGGGDQPRMPATTNRISTRHNVSEQTPDSANRNMVSGLMGVDIGGRQNGKSAA